MMPCRRSLLTIVLICVAPHIAWSQTADEENREAVKRQAAKGEAGAGSASKVDPAQVAELIVERTNAFRKENQHSALSVNKELRDAAQYFADYMAKTDEYGHTADGNRPADRAKKFGYDYCIVLENIAYQYSSTGFETEPLATKFIEGWQESPGHRKNMLDPDVTETGVAIAQSVESGHFYAVQMFGRPKSAAIEFQITNQADKEVKYTIGDHEFPLPPRYTRTHQNCRPQEVAFQFGDDKKQDAKTIQPRNGDHYAITKDEGAYRIEKK